MGKFVSKFVFLPPNKFTIPDEDDLTLATDHGSKIQVKIIDRNAQFTIVVSHGNAEDIYSVLYWTENVLLKYVNVNVVMYGNIILNKEYTGYGSNEEDLISNETFLYNDIETVYNYLVNQLGVKPETIILYGRSLGSGPSCYLAEKRNVGGYIIFNQV